MWHQATIKLPARPRGMHLITDEVLAALPELRGIRVGLLHLFIQHTSASLTINENADPSVRRDMETILRRLVPEDDISAYEHTDEGPDDMTSHMKASLLGPSVSIPIANGRLALGTWQGIYLGEHREARRARTVIATLQGE